MPPAWADLAAAQHARRLDWADEAYRKFRTDLPPEVQTSLSAERGDTNVALYGPTQVGKTRMLLTLLQVRPERLPDVGEVLRGGRPQGMSATVTATTYHASRGDYWTWTELPAGKKQSAGPLTEAGIRERLAAVRASVEARSYDVKKTIDIGLPTSCFAENASFSVRVLDLPGVTGSDTAERAHARRLIRDRIAVMDMVLLVGRISQLGFLHPVALASDALQSWIYLPERFGVVLTHTYSNSTVRQWLSSGAVRTPGELRDRLVHEVVTHATPTPDVPGGGWLYPLEFGESWENTGKSLQQSRTLRTHMLAELSAAVDHGSRPEARIRHAYRVGYVAQQMRQKRKTELDEAVSQAEQAGDLASKSLRQCQMALAEHQKHISGTLQKRSRIDELSAFRWQAEGGLPRDWQFEGRTSGPVDEICARLRSEFRQVIAKWLAHDANIRRDMPDRVRGAVGDGLHAGPELGRQLERVLGEVFHDVRSEIDRRFMALRRPWWKRSREQLTGDIRTGYAVAIAQLQAALAAAATNRARAFRHAFDVHWEQLQRDHQELSARVTTANAVVEEKKKAVSDARSQRQRRLAVLDAAKATADNFPARLRASFESSRAGLIQAAATAADPVECLAAVVGVLDRTQVYDVIRQGEN